MYVPTGHLHIIHNIPMNCTCTYVHAHNMAKTCVLCMYVGVNICYVYVCMGIYVLITTEMIMR